MAQLKKRTIGDKCNVCGGTGELECPQCSQVRLQNPGLDIQCRICGDTGTVKCRRCKGTGLKNRPVVKVTIDEEVKI